MTHILLHFLVPLVFALVINYRRWAKTFMWLLAGLVIDLDHLLATPMYDPNRCSVGFHPLHTEIPIVLYCMALLHPKTRLFGLGLCIHILLDSIDCSLKDGIWFW